MKTQRGRPIQRIYFHYCVTSGSFNRLNSHSRWADMPYTSLLI